MDYHVFILTRVREAVDCGQAAGHPSPTASRLRRALSRARPSSRSRCSRPSARLARSASRRWPSASRSRCSWTRRSSARAAARGHEAARRLEPGTCRAGSGGSAPRASGRGHDPARRARPRGGRPRAGRARGTARRGHRARPRPDAGGTPCGGPAQRGARLAQARLGGDDGASRRSGARSVRSSAAAEGTRSAPRISTSLPRAPAQGRGPLGAQTQSGAGQGAERSPPVAFGLRLGATGATPRAAIDRPRRYHAVAAATVRPLSRPQPPTRPSRGRPGRPTALSAAGTPAPR